MSPRKKNHATVAELEEELICGSFTKRDAAQRIAKGVRHLHSSPLGDRDACARVALECLQRKKALSFPWEPSDAGTLQVGSSAERVRAIQEVIERCGLTGKRGLKDRAIGILEELVSNAIFHAYHHPDGEPKYSRRDAVILNKEEKVAVSFKATDGGLYLSVTDRGGSFRFEQVAKSFGRCYGNSIDQIETKEGGAGLGTYMTFELCTHLKYVSVGGQATTASCWIADKAAFDPDIFSFNFFEWR